MGQNSGLCPPCEAKPEATASQQSLSVALRQLPKADPAPPAASLCVRVSLRPQVPLPTVPPRPRVGTTRLVPVVRPRCLPCGLAGGPALRGAWRCPWAPLAGSPPRHLRGSADRRLTQGGAQMPLRSQRCPLRWQLWHHTGVFFPRFFRGSSSVKPSPNAKARPGARVIFTCMFHVLVRRGILFYCTVLRAKHILQA